MSVQSVSSSNAVSQSTTAVPRAFKYQDISLKCEAAAKKLRKESCKELCKGIGYLALGVIAIPICVKIAVEIAVFFALILFNIINATLLSALAVPITIIVVAGLAVGISSYAVDYVLKPIIDRAFRHFDRHEACQKIEFKLWNDSRMIGSLRS